MKSYFAIFAIIIIFTFSACEKDYTCSCTVTTSVSGDVSTSSYAEDILDTKKKAEEYCDSKNYDDSYGSGIEAVSTKTECELSE